MPTFTRHLATAIVTGKPVLYKEVVKELAPGGHVNFDLIVQDGTSLVAFKNQMGIVPTAITMFRIIEDMCMAFNTFTAMSQSQIEDIVDDFINDYPHVTIEDMVVFFDGIKKQRFGRVANRMDAGVIWEFWYIYIADRETFCIDRETAHNSGNSIVTTNKNGKNIYHSADNVRLGENNVADTIKRVKDDWKK